ncbi:MAG: DUF350 domain-containing protein [Oceanospirillaceae bacterium]|nr:DUF350 domain-containing protein [Oceanospirillaceae bacterium]MCP5349402.1 DUF350 domain-containing protein [Oceanospirillaceae bacterium]
MNPAYFQFILIDLLAVLTLVLTMRWLNRTWLHNKTARSGGINIDSAASMLALAIALSGVTAGEFSLTLWSEWVLVTSYGIFAILFLRLGAIFLDKWVLPTLKLNDELEGGNTSAAYLMGAHLIGTAIILRAAMEWVAADVNLNFQDMALSFLALFCGFVISQILLAFEARIRLSMGQERIVSAITNGDQGQTLRACAQHIGAALAITGGAHFAASLEFELTLSALAWLLSSVLFLLAYMGLTSLSARIIIAAGDEQADARPLIESAIYLGWGLILPALAS